MILTKIIKIKDTTNLAEITGDIPEAGALVLFANIHYSHTVDSSSAEAQKIFELINALGSFYIGIISQPLLEDYIAAVEIYYVKADNSEIYSHTSEYLKYQLLKSNSYELLMIRCESNCTTGYDDIFSIQHSILKQHNFTFNDVFRQWNYIPQICDLNEVITEYSKFNSSRKKYYSYDNLLKYPAATGIGVLAHNAGVITMSIKGDYRKYYLENGLQTSAFRYSDRVISTVCDSDTAKPLFSRAVILETGDSHQLFLSGTAAIRGEQSVDSNLTEQLKITIENIKNLVKADNILKATGLNFNKVLPEYLKIYVKPNIDTNLIEQIMQQEFDIKNYLTVQADICRPELLIEIEGIFVLS